MKSIDADIKNGKISNIYLLMGIEPYLMKQYRDKLVRALVKEDDQLNYRYYCNEMPDIGEVIEYADTVPFFAPQRVIVLENTGLFKAADKGLAEYLRTMPDTTYIIFVESYTRSKYSEVNDEKKYENHLIDKRYKLYKCVEELGRVVRFERLSEDTITTWLLRRIKDSGLAITRNAMDCLLEYAGNDMTTLQNELDKLISYRLGHKSIDVDDVREICTRNISNDVFNMVEAIAVKNLKKARRLYYDLLALKIDPFNIMSLISNEFSRILKVKSLSRAGRDNKEIGKMTGIHPYYVKKYIATANRFTYEYLEEALSECAETDYLLKQGRLEPSMGIEMLIVKYAG